MWSVIALVHTDVLDQRVTAAIQTYNASDQISAPLKPLESTVRPTDLVISLGNFLSGATGAGLGTDSGAEVAHHQVNRAFKSASHRGGALERGNFVDIANNQDGVRHGQVFRRISRGPGS